MKVSFDFLESCQLLLDGRRVAAHARALASAITPGSIVVDIGTGVGIFAMLACRYGARKVYAIDARPMIHLASEVAAANGLGEAIEFIQDDPRRVALPERADVIVCDVRSVLPEAQVPVLIDARRRLLADGGVVIPGADRLWASVIDSSVAYEAIVGIWRGRPYGIDAAAALRRSAHTWIDKRLDARELKSEPVCWCVIDYRTVDDDAVAGTIDAVVPDRGVGHGLCVWVEPDLPGGDLRPAVGAFFPWPEPVAFEAGDRVHVSIDGQRDARGYRWRWQTSVRSSRGVERIAFVQDTAEHTAAHALPQALRYDEDSHPPPALLREDLSVDRFVLSAMERGLSIGAIAEELLVKFPAAFSTHSETLTYAGVMSARYG